MTRGIGKTLGVVALLSALAACGSAEPSGTAPSTKPTVPSVTVTSPPPTMTPPHDFAAARQVTVMRSGGLKPVKETLVFAMDKPAPDGFTRADVAAVLEAAAAPALKTPPSPPRDTCCDRYVYRVAIAYPDGTTSTFTTVDGASTTPAVTRLLALAT
jgi:hypothetical protein